MIAAQQEEGVGEKDFVTEQEENAFATEMTAIHVVAEEKITLLAWRAAHFEKLHQVVKLEDRRYDNAFHKIRRSRV